MRHQSAGRLSIYFAYYLSSGLYMQLDRLTVGKFQRGRNDIRTLWQYPREVTLFDS